MAPGDLVKADQIAFHIYTKLFRVLYAASASEQGRGQGPGQPQGKVDNWAQVNLETPLAPSAVTPTAELDLYRSLSSSYPCPYSSVSASDSTPSSSKSPPPLALQVLLAIPSASTRGGTALVHISTGARVEPEPREVLLEEWVLAFSLSASTSGTTDSASTASRSSSAGGGASDRSRKSSTDEDTDVLLPTMYKNAIPCSALGSSPCYGYYQRGASCASSWLGSQSGGRGVGHRREWG
ncbi:hypothetical protein K438DRAFT_1820135 [Mycena galopus ATCC 62051]|nr:hypothetical protein K438DRAFT_1820135 [Mycena galopus ATCC 62051]